MKTFDVGRVVTLLANLGVIASIVFLGLELRITNDQARISVSQEMNHSLTEWQLQLIGDSTALDTYVRGLQNFDALDRTWWSTADRRGLSPTVIPITDNIVEMASN